MKIETLGEDATLSVTRAGEELGLVQELCGELKLLRVHFETLPPGRRASRGHYHTRREECVLILSGTATLRWGGGRTTLSANQLVSLPAGPPTHQIVNEGSEPATMLVFSANVADEVVYEES